MIEDVYVNPAFITVGTTATIEVTASDPDGDQLQYSWSSALGDIIGSGAALKYALHRVEQVASTDTTVLIEGETGTGKELISKAIHDSMAGRIVSMIRRIGVNEDIAMIGGMACNPGFIAAMLRELKVEKIYIPDDPEFGAAAGAAVVAAAWGAVVRVAVATAVTLVAAARAAASAAFWPSLPTRLELTCRSRKRPSPSKKRFAVSVKSTAWNPCFWPMKGRCCSFVRQIMPKKFYRSCSMTP